VTSPYALLRLLARPAVLLLLVPCGAVLLLALDMLLSGQDTGPLPVRRAWDAATVARASVWYATMLLALAAGFVVHVIRLEAQHRPVAWLLPGLRRGLLAGTLTVAVPVSLAVAVLARVHLEAGDAVAAFFLALLVFMLAGAVVDGGLGASLRWSSRVLLLALAALFGYGAAEGVLLAAVPLFAATVVLVRLQFSRATARRHPYAGSVFEPVPGLASRSRGHAPELVWQMRLDTMAIVPWLRAAQYESLGVARFGYLTGLLLSAVPVATGFFTRAPELIVILAGVAFAGTGLQLSGHLHYPLPRARRAPISLAGTLVHAGAYCAAMAAFALAFETWGGALPRMTDIGTSTTGPFTAIGLAFALAPIAQWSAIRGEPISVGGGLALREWGPIAGYMGAAIVAQPLLSRGVVPAGAAALVVLAAAVYTVHAAAVARYFARSDLARP
jgi:hypothetical protein